MKTRLLGDPSLRITVSLSTVVGREVYFRGTYEPRETSVVRRIAKPDWVAMDIGANQGVYTLPLAKRCRKVYAFEPTPQMADILHLNVQENGLADVDITRAAVSSLAGTCVLMTDLDSGKNTIGCGDSRDFGGSINVDVVTLDEFVAIRKVGRVDFIKMDVEGAELDVLKGARSMLGRFRPIILCEFFSDESVARARFGHASEEQRSFLAGLGYSFWEAADFGESPMDFRLVPDTGQRVNLFAALPEHVRARPDVFRRPNGSSCPSV